jgi:hypothetical protein
MIFEEHVPHLPLSIELHDSDVFSISLDHGIATVRLRPAYVHRDGKGWNQDADIVIRESTLEGTQAEFPATIADGSLQTENGPYHNLLELPLSADGRVSLNIEFFSGNIATVRGRSVEVILFGAPVFIEDVDGRI